MNSNDAIRVVVVEDNHLLRHGLKNAVAAMPGFDVVDEAMDGREACQVCVAHCPDIVLMDISMPVMSGMEAANIIKRRHPTVKVVLLTIHSSTDYIREAIRSKVDGYLLKDASLEELHTALDAVAKGHTYFAPASLFPIGMMRRDDVTPPASPRPLASPARSAEAREAEPTYDELARLTAQERRIMTLVASGQTNRAAADLLRVSTKTIEKHRARLMQKLGLRNAAELVRSAMALGLVEGLQAHRSRDGSLEG